MTNQIFQDVEVLGSIDAQEVGTNLTEAILNLVAPVGTIVMSQNSPAGTLGGTWEQLEGDAYFKIVTSNFGTLGGTSSAHQIPITSIPQANNTITVNLGSYNGYQLGLSGGNTISNYLGINGYDANKGGAGYLQVNNGGGGQAYYPYYYGVYAWQRTA